MSQIQYTTLTNNPLNVSLVDQSGSALTVTSGILNVIPSDVSGTVASVQSRVQSPSGYALNVQIGPGDPLNNTPVVQEMAHHQVHEGEAYSYCNLQTGGLSSGSNFDIRISVPTLSATTSTPHIEFETIAGGECEVYLHQDVTWTAGGVDVSATATANATKICNRNHNSSNVPATKLYIDGSTALTVNSTGTLKYIWFLTSGRVASGTGDRSVNEIDLKSNTEYMLRLTSRTAALKFLLRLDWYEDLGV